MTPKEKAKELLDKMTMEIGKFNSKQCALIAVNEIEIVCKFYNDTQGELEYWQQVKTEIEKL